ncbi:9418_t:CDS:10 [Ambispora leptoticha]|uniref:9418_t:CDS:1 n=1 Tax=Ambispora leptoticha TaxID=144679 RepID=A0A9N8VUE7_9GLOM|nr:9418_t:CDS:10 [Ambispora leptoticha]
MESARRSTRQIIETIFTKSLTVLRLVTELLKRKQAFILKLALFLTWPKKEENLHLHSELTVYEDEEDPFELEFPTKRKSPRSGKREALIEIKPQEEVKRTKKLSTNRKKNALTLEEDEEEKSPTEGSVKKEEKESEMKSGGLNVPIVIDLSKEEDDKEEIFSGELSDPPHDDFEEKNDIHPPSITSIDARNSAINTDNRVEEPERKAPSPHETKSAPLLSNGKDEDGSGPEKEEEGDEEEEEAKEDMEEEYMDQETEEEDSDYDDKKSKKLAKKSKSVSTRSSKNNGIKKLNVASTTPAIVTRTVSSSSSSKDESLVDRAITRARNIGLSRNRSSSKRHGNNTSLRDILKNSGVNSVRSVRIGLSRKSKIEPPISDDVRVNQIFGDILEDVTEQDSEIQLEHINKLPNHNSSPSSLIISPSTITTPSVSETNNNDSGNDNLLSEIPNTINSTAQSSASTQNTATDDNRFIVVLKKNNTTSSKLMKHLKWIQSISANESINSHLASNLTSIGKFSWYAGVFDDHTLDQINSSDVIQYITPDIMVKSYHNIEINPPSWGLSRITKKSLPLENKYHFPDNAGLGVNIYVIDTGINTDHNDLEGRASFGTAFLGNLSEQRDLNGHGTFVAGVLVGKYFGVAKKANVISVRALQPDGSGRLSTVLQAIDWVIKRHNNSTTKKTIINLSLGAEYNAATNEAIQNAMDLGIHFTIAAGNEGKDACQFSPASAQGALTVGATNNDDTIAKYSNTGSCVDIYAPGTNIISIWNTSKSATHMLSGTSMASPHVAGVMAILLSQGNYTPSELVEKIKGMATVCTSSNFELPVTLVLLDEDPLFEGNRKTLGFLR